MSVILAKDQATRELWWRDDRFQSFMDTQPKEDFWVPGGEYQTKYYLTECDYYYYQAAPLSMAFYHRAVSVKRI
jgi:hypothetical protein